MHIQSGETQKHLCLLIHPVPAPVQPGRNTTLMKLARVVSAPTVQNSRAELPGPKATFYNLIYIFHLQSMSELFKAISPGQRRVNWPHPHPLGN